MQRLLQLYPNDPTKGAPYGTGSDFELTPMWKRIASLMGDMNVIAVRRLFVEKLANLGQNAWTYSRRTLVTRHPSMGFTEALLAVYRRNKASAWGSVRCHSTPLP